MITGEFTNKLEGKNRLALPKKFRNTIGSEIIITRSFENCLLIVNKKQWQNLLTDLEDKPFFSGANRDTRRFLIGGASEIKIDKQGRFVVPDNLKDFAKLKKEVIFIGLGDWIEIWDKQNWAKKLTQIQQNASSIAEKINKNIKNEN